MDFETGQPRQGRRRRGAGEHRLALRDGAIREMQRAAPDGAPAIAVIGIGGEARAEVFAEAELWGALAELGCTAAPRVLARLEDGYLRERPAPVRRGGGRRIALLDTPATTERVGRARARADLEQALGAMHAQGWALAPQSDAPLALREDGSVAIADLRGLQRTRRLSATIADRHWIADVLADADRTLLRRPDEHVDPSDPERSCAAGLELDVHGVSGVDGLVQDSGARPDSPHAFSPLAALAPLGPRTGGTALSGEPGSASKKRTEDRAPASAVRPGTETAAGAEDLPGLFPHRIDDWLEGLPGGARCSERRDPLGGSGGRTERLRRAAPARRRSSAITRGASAVRAGLRRMNGEVVSLVVVTGVLLGTTFWISLPILFGDDGDGSASASQPAPAAPTGTWAAGSDPAAPGLEDGGAGAAPPDAAEGPTAPGPAEATPADPSSGEDPVADEAIPDAGALVTALAQQRYDFVTGRTDQPVALAASPAAAEDAQARDRYAGSTVEGGVPVVETAVLESYDLAAGTATIATTVSTPAHRLVTSDAAEHVPATGPAAVRLRLVHADGRWRVERTEAITA